MKNLILLFVLLISLNISAQQKNKTKNLFIRVYNLEYKKIGKGYIFFTNDSSIVLIKNEKLKKINLGEIGKIKTKRSGGSNILFGATTGILVGAILGSINPPTETSGGTFNWAGKSSGVELASGITVGIISGAILGGITIPFKNSKTYKIEANPEKWRVFTEAVKFNTPRNPYPITKSEP